MSAPQEIPELEWLVTLQHVTATQGPKALGPNNVNDCSPSVECTALLDTGTFDLALPPNVFVSIQLLLGLPTNPALNQLVQSRITGRQLITAQGYPRIDCSARALAGPTLDFQIQDRVYSLVPNDYIFEVRHHCPDCTSKV